MANNMIKMTKSRWFVALINWWRRRFRQKESNKIKKKTNERGEVLLLLLLLSVSSWASEPKRWWFYFKSNLFHSHINFFVSTKCIHKNYVFFFSFFFLRFVSYLSDLWVGIYLRANHSIWYRHKMKQISHWNENDENV